MGEAAISGCNGPELQLLLRLLAHTKERHPTARACARRAAPTCYFTRERHQDVSEQVAHSLAARDTAHSSSNEGLVTHSSQACRHLYLTESAPPKQVTASRTSASAYLRHAQRKHTLTLTLRY
jgi:hypothetical protein